MKPESLGIEIGIGEAAYLGWLDGAVFVPKTGNLVRVKGERVAATCGSDRVTVNTCTNRVASPKPGNRVISNRGERVTVVKTERIIVVKE